MFGMPTVACHATNYMPDICDTNANNSSLYVIVGDDAN